MHGATGGLLIICDLRLLFKYRNILMVSLFVGKF